MAISAYPRTAVQGSTASGNPQNGLSLMLLNSTSGQYEAATSATFAGGGGGGGDATAANQTSQINLATSLNSYLLDSTTGYSAVTMLGFIAGLLNDLNSKVQLSNTDLGNIRNELISLNQAIISGEQVTQIIGDGNIAFVNASNELKIKSGA
jgi:hypothetical protein